MAFDAFISYARVSSTDEAQALKSGLEAYARPWNKARSMHVFLDDASLSASPSLTGTLADSLAQSDWLIVLLTEAAARSPWVDQEVAWWMEHKSTDRMLLVHIDGSVAWQRGVGFAESSTVVPPSLRALRTEPRWVDMTWFSRPDSLRREDPRFTDVVLQVFCPVRGLERGEAVALRDTNVRRARRLARGAIATLSTLLVLALVSAGIAVTQMREAQQQTRIATGRLLSAESQRLLDQNVGRSRLMAAQANSILQDGQSRSTLFRSLTAGPYLVGEIAAPTPKSLATTPDGSQVFMMAQDGQILAWNVAERRTSPVGAGCSGFSRALQVSDDGKVVVGQCVDGTGFAYAGTNPIHLSDRFEDISVSPSGRTIAYITGQELFVATNDGTGFTPRRVPWEPSSTGMLPKLALRDDDTVTVVESLNAVGSVFSLNPWRENKRFEFRGSAVEHQRLLSRTGEAYWDAWGLWTLPAKEAGSGSLAIDPAGDYHDFRAMAISNRGDTAAYARSGGGIEVTTPHRGATGVTVRARLEAGDSIGPIAIGGKDVVVAGHDGVVSVWNLRRTSPLVSVAPLQGGALKRAEALSDDSTVLVPNHTGSVVAFADYEGFSVMDAGGKPLLDESGDYSDTGRFAGWASDTEFVYLQGDALRRFDISSRTETGQWQIPPSAGLLGWDAATGTALLIGMDTLHRFNPVTGADDVIPLDGRLVTDVSLDGTRLLVGEGGRASQVWDSQLKQLLYQAPEGVELGFATNGDIVEQRPAVSWTRLVNLDADPEAPSDPRSIEGEGISAFTSFAVDRNRTLYLTTETHGVVKLREFATGHEWGQLPLALFQDDANGEWAYASFSGDGRRVVYISANARGAPILTVVDIDTDTMARAVCDSVRRGLEPAEWRELTGREPSAPLACQP